MIQLFGDSDYYPSSGDDFEAALMRRNKRPKNENYFEHVVPQYNDAILEHFRVRRQVAEDIAEKYKESSYYNHHAGGNGKIFALRQILIFLWFAGHQSASFRDVADRFNISISTLCDIVKKVTRFISSLAVDIIKWPSAEESEEIDAHFRGKGMPGVIGAIDGTHIRIDKPQRDPDSYLNRKQFHSIQLQVVCDHTRRIRDIFVGYPGSVHDGRVFRTSPLFETLEEKCKERYILGDSAYPCLKHLLTPYRNTGYLSRQQNNFNVVLSRSRCVVEHCFGILKQRFRQLYHIKLRKVKDTVHFIQACCVLHNLAMEDNLEFEDIEGEVDDDDPAEAVSLNLDNRDDRTGVNRRNNIAAQLLM